MKKLLILITALPLLAFSQEMPIAWRIDSVWNFSPDIVIQAQLGMDSVAISQSETFKYTYDSVGYQNDSVITMFMSKDSVLYVDRMLAHYRADTLWTTPDGMKEACGNTCTVYDCTGGCLKTANCDCSCVGYCVGTSLGVTMGIPAGELTRRRILSFNGNEIPEE